MLCHMPCHCRRDLKASWPGKSPLRGIPRCITTHSSNANDFGFPSSATRTGAACRMRDAACGRRNMPSEEARGTRSDQRPPEATT